MFSGIFIFGHNAKDLSHYGCRSPYIIRSYIERVKFSTLHHANWKHYRWMLPFLSISATLANVAGVLYIPMTRAASSKLVPLNEQGILIFGIDYLKEFFYFKEILDALDRDVGKQCSIQVHTHSKKRVQCF